MAGTCAQSARFIKTRPGGAVHVIDALAERFRLHLVYSGVTRSQTDSPDPHSLPSPKECLG